MGIRFEVFRNGQRVCMSGIEGDGVLGVGVNYVNCSGRPPSPSLELHIGGLGHFDGSQKRQHHASWPTADIRVGDEITIRILPAGEFDEPLGMTKSPKRTIDDPDFGKMKYYIDAWDADIPFNSPPLETAHIHLWAGKSGPTDVQRHLLRELMRRHATLWPTIRTALGRCYGQIDTVEELDRRINQKIGIDLTADPESVKIQYKVAGELEDRAFSVTLRNWEITEIFGSH